MIEWLKVYNFQGYESYTIEFDPLVTTIVGPSDVGKSALLRALRWVCLNKPNGMEFIRTGAKRASAILGVDGRKIARRRGKSSNTYKLDSEMFRAFGATVPDPIQKLLNVAEINFQDQHDSPFWFSESPGQVSKELNQVVDLEIIDRTLATIAARARKAKESVSIIRNLRNAAQERMSYMSFVPEMRKERSRLNGIGREALEASVEASELGATLEKMAGLREIVRAGEKQVQLGQVAVRAGKEAQEVADQLEGLTALLAKIKRQREATTVLEAKLASAEKRLADATKKGACPLCQRPFK